MEYESDGDRNCHWHAKYSPYMTWSETGRLKKKWTSGDHSSWIIVEIGQNNNKIPAELRRIAVTKTQAEIYQLC